MKLQEIMFKHQWHALFDHMSYLVIYLLCNALCFSSLCIFLCLPWDACIDKLNMIPWQFILLFWSCACYELPMYVAEKCHGSVPYEIPMRFTQCAVCSLGCSFLSSPGSRRVCFSLWCLHWKTLRHKFVLFSCLEGKDFFFHRMLRNTYFPLRVGKNSCYVSNKW